MKKYPAYKDSGIEWIGEIPQDWWGASNLKYCLTRNDGGAWGSDFDDDGTIVLRSTEIGLDGNWNIKEPARRSLSEIDVRKTQLEVGDLLITKSSGSEHHIGKTALVDETVAELKPCFSNFMQRIRVAGTCDSRYVHYFLNSNLAREQYNYLSQTTTGLANLSAEVIGNLKIPFLPSIEQQAIADYLDTKTALIDQLIAKKRRQIELLTEQRQAVINQAVTKGLDPNVEMKDSGIEWLGEIPKHWDRCKLKHLVGMKITDGPHETPEFVDEGIPFISAESIKEDNRIDFNSMRGFISEELHVQYCKKCKPVRDDVFMIKSGATTGRIGMVEVDCEFSIWSPLALIRADGSKMLPRLVYYSLRSEGFQDGVRLSWSFGTQQNIGMGVIENLYVVVPPIQEQPNIVDFIEKELRKIDDSVQKAQKQIELLREYRTALISEAVTGKIDVRGE